MDVLEAIYQRRSIRKYTHQPVPENIVRELLGAAMMAPSAGNAQPWQFVVITDRAALAEVKAFNPYAGMAARAPLAILVCGDLDREKHPGYWVQDCAAATQNLLLAAQARGLGAVWTGIYPIAERIANFSRYFGLPERVIPLALIVIGWPAQSVHSEDRYRAECVHRERWSPPGRSAKP
jgi:nitroreductase